MTVLEKTERISSCIADLSLFEVPISAAVSSTLRFTGQFADDDDFVRALEMVTKRMLLMTYRALEDSINGDYDGII